MPSSVSRGLISVAIPNYNKSQYLADCIDSVVTQDYPNIEIVVVDDASNDDSADILKALSRKYANLNIYYSDNNQGVSKCRDRAIMECNGEYITTLDSDDYYSCQNKLSLEYDKIQEHKNTTSRGCIAFSEYHLISNDGTEKKMEKPICEGDILESIITRSCFIPRDFMFTKEQYIEVGGIDPEIPIYEDWDLKIRLAAKNNYYFTGSDCIAYRRHGSGLSSADAESHIKWLNYVFHKNEDLIDDGKLQHTEELFNRKSIYPLKYHYISPKKTTFVRKRNKKNNDRPSGNPVFLHSLFRAGSTYIFSKLRDDNGFYCYYEPLHHELTRLNKDGIEVWKTTKKAANNKNHPVIKKPHFYEYIAAFDESESLPHINESFCYKEYFKVNSKKQMKKYIDLLIHTCPPGMVPLLQFNRTASRICWFKTEYPDATNIFLLRNPRVQFDSYYNIEPLENNSFLAINLIILKSDNGHICDDEMIKMKLNISESLMDSDIFSVYEHAKNEVRKFPIHLHYRLFLNIWIKGILHAMAYADNIIDMDRLGKDTEYRNYALSSFNVLSKSSSVDFSDYRINVRKRSVVKRWIYRSVEEKILDIYSESDEIKEYIKDQAWIDENRFDSYFSKFTRLLQNYIVHT